MASPVLVAVQPMALPPVFVAVWLVTATPGMVRWVTLLFHSVRLITLVFRRVRLVTVTPVFTAVSVTPVFGMVPPVTLGALWMVALGSVMGLVPVVVNPLFVGVPAVEVVLPSVTVLAGVVGMVWVVSLGPDSVARGLGLGAGRGLGLGIA